MAQLQKVKEQAREAAERQKEAGADEIGDMADAISAAADTLQSEFPTGAEYVHDAASRLQGAANALRERDIGQLTGSLTDFAHRQPALFFGGAVVAGIAISRLLKSSAHAGSNAAH
jgi:uncharacterized phage infection (PIP) family protein YhgE